MIREYPIKKVVTTSGVLRLVRFVCLEADFSNLDTTGIANGSELIVLDAANNPMRFDEENSAWYDSTGTAYTGGGS